MAYGFNDNKEKVDVYGKSETYAKTEIDTKVNGKQDTITGAATTVTNSNLTKNRVLISNNNGKIGASSISTTILGYLSGLIGNVQDQLNGKQSALRYFQKDKTAQAPVAGDVYSVTVTFTSAADGYDAAKDTGMFSVYSDTNSIRIVSVTKDTSEFSNTKVQYYVLFTGTTNGAIGTITFRLQMEQ